ncbi:MAG: carboxypeptidase-like regulatory domain-containing protein [Acidobacteriota bacterium]
MGRPDPGVVSCPVVAGRWICTLPAGTLDLRVRVPGFVSHYFWGADVPRRGDLDVGILRFQAGASLVGWVEADSGRLLEAGTRVEMRPGGRLTPLQNQRDSGVQAVRHSTDVDERGFFHFRGVAPGTYRLQANESGGPPSRPIVVTVVANSEITLERPLLLEPWAELEILVTPALPPDGNPWRVELADIDVQRSVSETIARHVCDSSGTVAFARLTPGEYVLKAKAGDGNTWYVGRVDAIPGRSVLGVQVNLFDLSGRLLLGDRPLTGKVWFGGAHGSVRIKVSTDAKGRFHAWLPRGGKWPVEVIGESARVKRSFGSVDLGSSSRKTGLELVVPDTCIVGEVLDEDGSLVPEGMVTVVGDKGLEQTVQVPLADGRFEIWGLDPGSVTVRAEQRDADSDWLSVPLKQGDDPARVKLTLRRKALVNGRVVAGGRPVPGARLVAWSAASYGGLPDGMTETGVDGSFSLRLPSRNVEEMLAVEAAGFSRRALRVPAKAQAALEIPVSQEGGVLVASFAEPPRYTDPMFSGYVVLHAGVVEDYFGLEIWARRHGREPQGAAEFEIPALEPGEYAICKATPSEFPLLAAGGVPRDRCAVATVTAGGRALVRVR